MNNVSFEQAKAIANAEAKKYGKIVTRIEENDEYWRFDAEFEDGHDNIDDGIGSVYVSKKDGSVRGLQLWDMEFTEKFKENSKVIYNYFEKQNK